MKHWLLPLAASIALVIALPARTDPDVPLIHHQGVLKAPDGSLLQGPRKLAFRLFDSADAATPAWGPQVFDGVVLVEGRYAVILGTTDSSGRPLAGTDGIRNKFIGIEVDGVEIQPRQAVLATAPAEASRPAPTPGGAAGVPAGTISAFSSNNIPDGWLLCDGSLVPQGGRYDALRELIGGNLPDLRGLFLRGMGQNSNPAFRYAGDATRTLWQFQPDELKSHEHKFEDFTFSANSGVGGNAWGSAEKSDIDNAPGSPFSHTTAPTGGEETRPKNAAVYWIIKY